MYDKLVLKFVLLLGKIQTKESELNPIECGYIDI